MKKAILFLAISLLMMGCKEKVEDKGIICKKQIIPEYSYPMTQVIFTGNTTIPVVTIHHKPTQYIVYAFSEEGIAYKCELPQVKYDAVEVGDTIFAKFEIIESN